jgi:hypothetical protein
MWVVPVEEKILRRVGFGSLSRKSVFALQATLSPTAIAHLAE